MTPHASRRLPLAASLLLLGPAAGVAWSQGAAEVVPVAELQGPYAGLPVGLQLVDAAAPQLPRTVIRTAGIGTGSLVPWTEQSFGAPAPGHPDYSPQALYAHWVPTLLGESAAQWSPANAWQTPVLGGFSTGGDVMPPVDATGRLLFGGSLAPAWYSLSFVVGSEAEGLPGSAVAIADGNPAGWVFTHFEEGSTLIRSQLVDTVVVDYTRQQIGLAGASSATQVVTGLDWGMGWIASTEGGTTSPLQPYRDLYYFTIDDVWIDTFYPAPGPWLFLGLSGLGAGSAPTYLELDPGTVYGMAWDGAAWSAPAVAFDHAALFGSPQTNVAIDALSVYKRAGESPSSPSGVVFSLEPDSEIDGLPANQILVSQRPSAGSSLATVTAEPLLGSSGTSMTAKLGLVEATGPTLGPDDVDGLCGRDPNELQHRDPYVGCAVDVLGETADSALGLALFRRRHLDDDTVPEEELVLALSGIDLAGHDLGLLVLELEDSLQALPQHPITFAPGVVSSPIVLVASKDPVELRFPVGAPKGNELRLRARLHAVTLDPFKLVPDHAVSWVSALGQP